MLTLAEARAHLVDPTTDDDAYITRLIDAATNVVENTTHRVVVQASFTEALDGFSGEIILPKSPFVSVTSFVYDDTDDVEQTLVESTDFDVDTRRPRAILRPVYDGDWPTAHPKRQSVRVTYTAGYATVPEAMKAAASLVIGSLYEQRENHAAVALYEPPVSVKYLLAPYCIPAFG